MSVVFGTPLYNPAAAQIVMPNTPFLSRVIGMVPLFISIPTNFEDEFGVPLINPPTEVFVCVANVGGQNTVNARDGNLYETIGLFPVAPGAKSLYEATNLFTLNATYTQPRDFSRFTLTLLDTNFAQLYLPIGEEVKVLLKLFYSTEHQ